MKSSGPEVSQVRASAFFDSLQINDKFDVTIFKGTEFKIEVIAGQNLLSNISTKVKGTKLIVSNNNRCNFVRGYKRVLKLNITVPYVRYIENLGVGTLWVDGAYKQDTLIVRAESSGDMHVSGVYNEIRTSSHGNGDMYIDGSCNTFFVYSKGINFLFAKEIKVRDYIFIETLSIGDCHINLDKTKNFEYNIHEDGNIFYAGKAASVVDFSDGLAKGRLIEE